MVAGSNPAVPTNKINDLEPISFFIQFHVANRVAISGIHTQSVVENCCGAALGRRFAPRVRLAMNNFWTCSLLILGDQWLQFESTKIREVS